MRLTLTALLALAALAGCTTSTASPNTAGSPSPAPPSPAAAPPKPAGPNKIGALVVHPDGHADTTVLDYRQPVSGGIDANPGMEWSAAEVKVCIRRADGKNNTVSQDPWVLLYSDGSQYESAYASGPDFPKPEYPTSGDRIIPAGRCVKGWITFEVPKGRRPGLVSYSVEGLPEPIEWAIPGA